MDNIQRVRARYQSHNIVDMVDEHMVAEDRRKTEARAQSSRLGKFYPSSVGQCNRRIYNTMKGVVGKPIEPRYLLIMENGTYFHHRMEEMFEDMGILIAKELVLKNEEYRISGRTDALIWNYMKESEEPIEGDKEIELYQFEKNEETGEVDQVLAYKGWASNVLLVEFKSSRDKAYDNYIPKSKPQKEHNMQLQLYFHLTGINQGLVFYENKNTQGQKSFYVERDEKVVNEVINQIKTVIEAYDKDEAPPREFEADSINCRYCNFRDICHPSGEKYPIESLLFSKDETIFDWHEVIDWGFDS